MIGHGVCVWLLEPVSVRSRKLLIVFTTLAERVEIATDTADPRFMLLSQLAVQVQVTLTIRAPILRFLHILLLFKLR